MAVLPALLFALTASVPQDSLTLKAYYAKTAAIFATETDDNLEAWARMRRSKALARESVRLIRIDQVPKDDLLGWSDIFYQAGDRAGAVRLAERFVDRANTEDERYLGAISLSFKLTGHGEYARSAATLSRLKPPVGKAGQTYRNAVGYLLENATKKGPSPELGTKLYAQARETLDGPAPTEPREAAEVRRSRDELLVDYAGFIGVTNGPEAGKSLLRKGLEGRTDKAYVLHAKLAQMELVGKPIPELKAKENLGTFPGFAAWRGKVVLAVFTAHWCGPCIGEIPMLREMQERRRDLRLVSVTAHYGFYDQEKNLTPAAETARTAAWMRQYGMNWPLVFTEEADHNRYGVHGIPHIVIVDKQGIVRGFKFGFGGDLEELEKQVAALAAE